jgi:biotin carboxylase
MDPVLIVLCAGRSEYRGPMLARIAGRYPLVLVSPDPPTWELDHVRDHVVVDQADTAGYIAAAVAFADTYPVAGVFTYYEWCVEMAAIVGETLGVPHCTPAAATRCRDKWETRTALSEAGVPSAISVLVDDVREASDAARAIGYPVVVKPRALSASFGVSLVSGPGELVAAFDRAGAGESNGPWEFRRGVLVEEYLAGDEISVDSTVAGGRVETAVYARKIHGYAPYFEELGHIVAAPELIVGDPVLVHDIVAAAHHALGVDNAVTHTELRLTPDGPRIVEVNGRSGGDYISELALLATGIDVGVATGDIAAGRPVTHTATHHQVAGVRFLYAEEAGAVDTCEIGAEVTSAPWLERVVWLVKRGDQVSPTPGRRYFARVGFAVVTAGSVAECAARMETVAAHAVVRTAARVSVVAG